MNKTYLAVLSVIMLLALTLSFVSAEVTMTVSDLSAMNGNSGNIKTTRSDCGSNQTNVNHFNIGEDVYIHGDQFATNTYEWQIEGNDNGNGNGGASCDPGIVVASGNHTVTVRNGDFCFYAYTVQPNDCGEYKVDFGNKGDNYRVIPEYGFVAAIVAILGAIAVFYFVRRN